MLQAFARSVLWTSAHTNVSRLVRQQIPKAKIPTNDQVTLRGSLSAIVRSDSSCFLIEWMDRSYTNHVQ